MSIASYAERANCGTQSNLRNVGKINMRQLTTALSKLTRDEVFCHDKAMHHINVTEGLRLAVTSNLWDGVWEIVRGACGVDVEDALAELYSSDSDPDDSSVRV